MGYLLFIPEYEYDSVGSLNSVKNYNTSGTVLFTDTAVNQDIGL